MATTILFMWTIVASSNGRVYRDWRAEAEFTSMQKCKEAALKFGNVPPNRVRCVAK